MENADYFQLFGQERRYEIDRAELDSAYERLSLAHHPDFFATAPPEEQARRQRISARLNEGYRVLTSNPERTAYLLGLLAGDRKLDTKALPAGFLQEVFELQEAVDALEADGTPEQKAALRAEVHARLEAVRAERSRLFAESGDGQDISRLQAIQSNLNCEHYLQRLSNRLE